MGKKKKTGVAAVLGREVKRMVSRPLYVLVTLVLPLVSFGIFGAIFHEGVPRDLPVAVYDADHSALSRQVIRMIEATPVIKVDHRVSNLGAGKRLVRSGKVYALIVLEKDLEQEALRGLAPPVINYSNNEFLLPASLITRDLRQAVGTLSAALDLRMRQNRGEMTHPRAGQIAPIRVESHVLFNPYLNYKYFLTSTLLPTMLQLFVIAMAIYALGIELKEGTAREWLRLAGGSPWRAVAGKLLPYTLLYLVVGLFMVTFLFRGLGVPLRGSLLLIATGTLLLVLAYQSIGFFLISLTSNLRLALSFAAFYASTAFAFVGVTFPEVGMPLPAKIWSGILPLSYYMKIFLDQSLRGAPVAISLTPLCVLALFVLCPLFLSLGRMGKLMREERYWGRL